LNQSNPVDDIERTQQAWTRSIYYSNPAAFTKYVGKKGNNVGALVLWLESKRISRHFGLNKLVHISWDATNNRYAVSNYIPREQRPKIAPGDQPVRVDRPPRTSRARRQQGNNQRQQSHSMVQHVGNWADVSELEAQIQSASN